MCILINYSFSFQGFLALPGVTLPLKNMSTCLPDAWQAVACALQLKPCSRSSHVDRICREDCLDLLTRCTDWARAPPGLTAAGLCNTLSPGRTDYNNTYICKL